MGIKEYYEKKKQEYHERKMEREFKRSQEQTKRAEEARRGLDRLKEEKEERRIVREYEREEREGKRERFKQNHPVLHSIAEKATKPIDSSPIKKGKKKKSTYRAGRTSAIASQMQSFGSPAPANQFDYLPKSNNGYVIGGGMNHKIKKVNQFDYLPKKGKKKEKNIFDMGW